MYTRERKRVACVVPPFYRLIESKNNRLTPAMHYIAETLHRRGHEVVLINGDYADESCDYAERLSMTLNSWLFSERYKNGHESYDDVMKALDEFRPDIIFLGAGDILMPTVEIGSTQSCSYLARRIKEHFGKEIICVGYGHLLKYAKEDDLKNLDVVISGEGEELAPLIVEGNFCGKTNALWCKEMDNLPILTGEYLYHKTSVNDWDYIMSMRGCPGRCTFCQQPTLRGYNVSTMSPERFIRELRYRIEKIGVNDFYFTDMIFSPGTGPRTSEMFNRLIALKKDFPNFNWWAEARVDTVTNREMVEKMKESGCRHLKFGVEMGNQDMLTVIKKNISLDEVKMAFDLVSEYDIGKTAYVLLGCPGFTDNDYMEMWHFFKELNAENYVININVPYLGTEIYDQIKDKLHAHGLYRDGEESFIHTSLIMKEFWGISDQTIDMFFSLQGKKDDSALRNYKRKIVDRDYYFTKKKIAYLDNCKKTSGGL